MNMRYLHYGLRALHPRNFFYLGKKTIHDLSNSHFSAEKNSTHIDAAMQWLCRAQDVHEDGGVAALYSLFDGWKPSYIETTGYIISTFFNHYHLTKNIDFKKRAIRMADFELKMQLKNGGFEGGRGKGNAVTFNTGQVLFGFCRAYKESNYGQYKDAAIRAADLLIDSQEDSGRFVKNLYMDCVHTYNTRTAWALLKVHDITKKERYKEGAIKNIEWALTQQQENGWFANNWFYPGQEPLVHTIAYSIRGILESGLYLKNENFITAALKSATALAHLQRKDGSLAGSFDENWKSSVSWSCLTGNSQMSIIWQKLDIHEKNDTLMAAAIKSNHYMKTVQDRSSRNPGINGAIPGAYPIYGWYAPFSYINWGTKFFVDALMLEEHPHLADKIDS